MCVAESISSRMRVGLNELANLCSLLISSSFGVVFMRTTHICVSPQDFSSCITKGLASDPLRTTQAIGNNFQALLDIADHVEIGVSMSRIIDWAAILAKAL